MNFSFRDDKAPRALDNFADYNHYGLQSREIGSGTSLLSGRFPTPTFEEPEFMGIEDELSVRSRHKVVLAEEQFVEKRSNLHYISISVASAAMLWFALQANTPSGESVHPQEVCQTSAICAAVEIPRK